MKCQYIWEGKECKAPAMYNASIIQTGTIDYKICCIHAMKLSELNREYEEVIFKKLEVSE